MYHERPAFCKEREGGTKSVRLCAERRFFSQSDPGRTRPKISGIKGRSTTVAYQKNGWPLLLLLRSNAAASQPPTFIVVHIQEKEEEEKVPTEIYAACISMFGSLGRERETRQWLFFFLYMYHMKRVLLFLARASFSLFYIHFYIHRCLYRYFSQVPLYRSQ